MGGHYGRFAASRGAGEAAGLDCYMLGAWRDMRWAAATLPV